jgi:ribosomal protein L12E/L44/L45/RPP1/RPP2
MAHTLESVLAFFGKEVEQVGGALVARVGGKNVEVGRIDNSTGVFSLTDVGATIVEAGKAPAKTKGKKTTKKETEDETDNDSEGGSEDGLENGELDLDIEV